MTLDRPIQSDFEKEIDELPYLILEAEIESQLEDRGVRLRRKALRRFARVLLECGQGTFDLSEKDLKKSSKTPENVTLQISDEALEARFQKFLEQMPTMIRDTARGMAEDLIAESRQMWLEDYGLRLAEQTGFQQRLRYRWREGLIHLSLLIEMSSEYGERRLSEETQDKGKQEDIRWEVLFSLHMRACQIAREILVLLHAGFADGAMARWRTLFEVVVIATLISDGDKETAEKYVAHNDIDAYKAARQYMTTNPLAEEEPIPEAEWTALSNQFEALIERYGKAFKNEYGWAAHITQRASPSFSDLIDHVGKEREKPIYKMASFNVHAGARSLFFRQTNLPMRGGMISGASNAGLADPGMHTAFALTQISALIGPDNMSALDDHVFLHVLVKLRELAEKGFSDAEAQLNLEEHGRFPIEGMD